MEGFNFMYDVCPSFYSSYKEIRAPYVILCPPVFYPVINLVGLG